MSTALAQPQSLLTPEVYRAAERQAANRSEYFNGQVYAMAGASREHVAIVANLTYLFVGQFKGRPCSTLGGDMRLKVSETGLYTYPDLMALCGEPFFDDDQQDTLLNPTVIVEVLSDSTERYDRGDKFAHYRRLGSLHGYLLVSQRRPRVEHYTRRGEEWSLREIDGLGGVMRLPDLGCELPLTEIYDSPIERDCLHILLRGQQPLIICPAGTLDGMRLPRAWQTALNAGCLLLLSPFETTSRRITAESVHHRNTLVAALADQVFIAHGVPGGQIAALAARMNAWRVPLIQNPP